MGKVIQIIPAEGWTAVFKDEVNHTKGDAKPLVCWALLEDGSLKGMVVDETRIKSVDEMTEPFSSYHRHIRADSLA